MDSREVVELYPDDCIIWDYADRQNFVRHEVAIVSCGKIKPPPMLLGEPTTLNKERVEQCSEVYKKHGVRSVSELLSC
jgi:hypothetical protein